MNSGHHIKNGDINNCRSRSRETSDRALTSSATSDPHFCAGPKLFVLTLLSVLVTAAVLCATSIPLGIPGEWEWKRQLWPGDAVEWLDRTLQPILTAALIGLFFQMGLRFIERSVIVRWGLLCGLVVLSFMWQKTVLQASASPHRELRPLWVLYDRFASGYFHEAVFEMTSADAFLSGYEARMAKGDVFHEGTHPPGLFLLSRFAVDACERWPAAGQFSEWLIGEESVRVFRSFESETRLQRPLSASEFQGLCLISVISTLLVGLTVIPVFGITHLLADHRTAWMAAALVITLPSLALFAPRSDVTYAFTGTMLLWLLLASFTRPASCSDLPTLAAGIWTFCCLLISLAHLPVLFAGVLLSLLSLKTESGTFRWQGWLRRWALFSLVVAILIFVVSNALNCNLLQVWKMNLQNHAGFYSQFPRTWWKWILVNPLELAFSLGLPVAVLSLCGVVRMVQRIVNRWSERTTPAFVNSLPDAFLLATTFTWMALWLSGKNMGEAARLWCFLLPWFAVNAALTQSSIDDRTSSDVRSRGFVASPVQWQVVCQRYSAVIILISQLLLCALTTGRVSGFQEL
jgi:hypothetical protein